MSEPPVYNYVPSFGASVSDNWFVTWDSTGAYVPQMDIGRLPVNSVDELKDYLLKHINYVQQKPDEWNKTFLFFSGGNGDNQSQLDQFRNVNEYVINNFVTPAPIGGTYNHFYKTINPKTNFGHYTLEQFQKAIDNGAVFISYIGHSATQTWDNSITDPAQLKNKHERYPLITDFGCSTARFGEPDVVSFSQLFVTSNQAISYIGNSSLGFVSTSTTVPQIFYRKILQDSVYQISEALKQAKIELISNYGSNEVNQLFTLTNTLIGDPIIKLAIPYKPDLALTKSDISIQPEVPTDNLDSVSVKLVLFNYGKVLNDIFRIKIVDTFSDSVNYEAFFIKNIPLLKDEFIFQIPVKNKAGIHNLKITVDDQNRIDEISKENNSIEINYNVVSSSLRTGLVYPYQNAVKKTLRILNPSTRPQNETISAQLSSTNDFHNANNIYSPIDTFFTNLKFDSIDKNKRYWIRMKMKDENLFGIPSSFYLGNKNKYFLNDSTSFNIFMDNLEFRNHYVQLDTSDIIFSALSAGFSDGRSAVISRNSQNFIPENTLRGHHICVFNKNKYEFVTYKHFDLLGGGYCSS